MFKTYNIISSSVGSCAQFDMVLYIFVYFTHSSRTVRRCLLEMRTKHSVLGNHLPVEHDYKLLPSACSTFEEKNPGSIAKCETDGDSHFTRFLILFHAQAQRCVKGGKHVFAIDGAFTKPDSQFKGQLLNISGFDANGRNCRVVKFPGMCG